MKETHNSALYREAEKPSLNPSLFLFYNSTLFNIRIVNEKLATFDIA
jgi:hypothetical protein